MKVVSIFFLLLSMAVAVQARKTEPSVTTVLSPASEVPATTLPAATVSAPEPESTPVSPWATTPVAPIRPAPALGWDKAYTLSNGVATAVIVPAIGRLVAFSSGDVPSLFRIDEWYRGKLPSNPGEFFNAGGDWIWPVAQSRWPSFSDNGSDWPPPPVMADGPWDCSAWEDADGARCAMLTRKYGAPLNIIVSRLFRLEAASSELVVRQRIERTEPSDIPVVLWNVSQIAKPDAVALPVASDSRFKDGLCTLTANGPAPGSLSNCGDVCIYTVTPGGEVKLGGDSPRAWLAAARGDSAIFECAAAGNMPGTPPDGGCVIEMYSNEGLGYTEIETLGPEVALQPGTILENTLRMRLAKLPADAAPCALADTGRALAGEPAAP
jgi:hypothetical protein